MIIDLAGTLTVSQIMVMPDYPELALTATTAPVLEEVYLTGSSDTGVILVGSVADDQAGLQNAIQGR